MIYTSDNGSVPIIRPRKNYEKGYNHPLKRGKWDATEGGIRVPFLISGPKIKSNSQTNVPISFSDLLPTIIDLAGKEISHEKLDGGSFKKLLFGESKKVERNFDGMVFHVPYENKIALGRAHSSIIVNKMKLIKFYDNNEIKLFDVENDLSENEDLSYLNKNLSKKLESKLENYLKDVQAPKWQPGITWKMNPLRIIDSYH